MWLKNSLLHKQVLMKGNVGIHTGDECTWLTLKHHINSHLMSNKSQPGCPRMHRSFSPLSAISLPSDSYCWCFWYLKVFSDIISIVWKNQSFLYCRGCMDLQLDTPTPPHHLLHKTKTESMQTVSTSQISLVTFIPTHTHLCKFCIPDRRSRLTDVLICLSLKSFYKCGFYWTLNPL